MCSIYLTENNTLLEINANCLNYPLDQHNHLLNIVQLEEWLKLYISTIIKWEQMSSATTYHYSVIICVYDWCYSDKHWIPFVNHLKFHVWEKSMCGPLKQNKETKTYLDLLSIGNLHKIWCLNERSDLKLSRI